MKAKITLKILTDAVLAISCLLLICFNSLLIYGLKMGKGQVYIVMNSRPVEDCLKDKQFQDSLKKKLLLIEDIRKYAMDSLGLKNSPNYTSVYDQKNKPAIWVLTACEPFELKIKSWWFPVVGRVPYKGFFSKEEAEAEQVSLILQGYDTKLGSTNGWSTLGWFRDPILSTMLYQSEGNLAELILHELTHSTVFVKDNIQYNENLANFVGETGAKKFLAFKFGKKSAQFIRYTNEQQDELTYNQYILRSLKKLDSLYKTLTVDQRIYEKKSKKEKLILAIVLGVQDLALNNKIRYIKISKRALLCKNAFFMEFIRYDSEHDLFEEKFRRNAGSNLKTFIKQQKQ